MQMEALRNHNNEASLQVRIFSLVQFIAFMFWILIAKCIGLTQGSPSYLCFHFHGDSKVWIDSFIKIIIVKTVVEKQKITVTETQCLSPRSQF